MNAANDFSSEKMNSIQSYIATNFKGFLLKMRPRCPCSMQEPSTLLE